jgi:hypothetical protein
MNEGLDEANEPSAMVRTKLLVPTLNRVHELGLEPAEVAALQQRTEGGSRVSISRHSR